MQRKCPSGHTRAKHGLHSRCSHSTRERADSGGVCSGLEEPNRATCGRSSAAATCIKPESLLTTSSAPAISSSASSKVVLPARSRPRTPAQASRSRAEPSITTGSGMRAASSAK
jgi:hypothetical protein